MLSDEAEFHVSLDSVTSQMQMGLHRWLLSALLTPVSFSKDLPEGNYLENKMI